MGGGEGFNDDTVMATLLAWTGCSLRPQQPKEKPIVYTRDDEEAAHQSYLLKRHRERIKEPHKLSCI